MRYLIKISIGTFIVAGLAFCTKREKYDPAKYNDLVYHAEEKKLPPPEYVFKATTNKGDWDVIGKATISGDTMMIEAKKDHQTFYLALLAYDVNSAFAIGEAANFAKVSAGTAPHVVYLSSGKSHGIVRDAFITEYNQFQASFEMVLYNETGTDSLVVANGTIRINFAPNYMRWKEAGKDIFADSVWSIVLDDRYEVYGFNSSSNKTVKLVIPKTSSGLMKLTAGADMPAAHCSVPETGNLKAVQGVMKLTKQSAHQIGGDFGVGVGNNVLFKQGSVTKYSLKDGRYGVQF